MPVGAALAAALAPVWAWVLAPPALPHYPAACAVFAACAVLELASEPLWVAAQLTLRVRVKVVAESAAQAARCVVTLCLLAWAPGLGLWAFCGAQAAYSAVLVLVYFVAAARECRALARAGAGPAAAAGDAARPAWPVATLAHVFPGRAAAPAAAQAALVRGFFLQSLLKNVLTEGERYVMTFFGVLSFEQQGVYDVVNNLGALVARFLFQVRAGGRCPIPSQG